MNEEERRLALFRTALILGLLVVTFTLGRWSVQFRRDGLSWVGLVLYVGFLVGILYLLVRDFWKR